MKLIKSYWKSMVGAGALLTVVALAASAAAEGDAKPKPYPLKTCLVSGEKLGGMGDPYVFTNKNQEIKLCCKGCLKDFEKDSAKYLKKLEADAKNNAKADHAEHPGHKH